MLKFDLKEQFEKEFRRRFGTEIFYPGGKVEHKLNVRNTEILTFCITWMHSHVTTVKQKKVAMSLDFSNDTFSDYLKDLELFAMKNGDAATALEINHRRNKFTKEVLNG